MAHQNAYGARPVTSNRSWCLNRSPFATIGIIALLLLLLVLVLSEGKDKQKRKREQNKRTDKRKIYSNLTAIAGVLVH